MSAPTVHRAVSSTDKAAILTLIDSRQKAAMELQLSDLTIWMNGDSAFSQGLVRWWGKQDGRDHSAPLWVRETMCFERRPEGWRIVHETASAPFPMDRGAEDSTTASTLRVGWALKDAAFQPCT